MNILYPIFVKLTGKKCIVIGGGRVATQKVKKLLKARGFVTVISPKVTEILKEYASRNAIQVIRRQYRAGDLERAFLVISATDSKKINESIAEEAREEKILCNIVDDPSLCDFYVPSICERDDLKIAISTNGKSPAVAKKIKEELSQLYGPQIGSLLKGLGSLRKKLARKVLESRRRSEILSRIVQSHTLYTMSNRRGEELTKLRKEIKRWS